MFLLTHLSFKIFPYGTAFDVIFVDSPIFNKNIVHGIMNMTQWKYSPAKVVLTPQICLKESLVNGKVYLDS
jgi:hypothetical protein